MTVLWTPPRLWAAPGGDTVWNALVSHQGQAFPLAVRGGSASFEPAAGPRPEAWTLRAALGGGLDIFVHVLAFPFREMFGVDLTAESVPGLPLALRDALAEGMAATVWNAMPDQGFGTLTVTGTGALGDLLGDTAPDAVEWFSAQIAGVVPGAIALLVGCRRDTLIDLLIRGGGPRMPRRAWNLGGQIGTEADYTLGGLALTVRELRTLRPGSLVVLPAVQPDTVVLRAGLEVIAFTGAGQEWQCVARRSLDRHQPPQDTVMDAERDAAPELPVAVDFDLGRVQIPLGTLESWQPGTVVALDPPARAAGVEVTIRANGAAIGSGDLVQIDDRLAVRITRLSFQS